MDTTGNIWSLPQVGRMIGRVSQRGFPFDAFGATFSLREKDLLSIASFYLF